MSKTIKMANGDFFVNESTGKLGYIDGPGKLAQDLIEEFLTEYDSQTNSGTRIRQMSNISLVRQEIAETVDRLRERQKKNKAISPREQIDEITQLVVKTYDGTDVVFMVEVSTVAKDTVQAMLIRKQGEELIPVLHQTL